MLASGLQPLIVEQIALASMSLLLGMQDILTIGELKVIIIPMVGRGLFIFLIQELNIRGELLLIMPLKLIPAEVINGGSTVSISLTNGKERLDVMTSVGDCSIYDGWWD